jgi:hypothetical protein
VNRFSGIAALEEGSGSGSKSARLDSDFRSWESRSSLIFKEEGRALNKPSKWHDVEDW